LIQSYEYLTLFFMNGLQEEYRCTK